MAKGPWIGSVYRTGMICCAYGMYAFAGYQDRTVTAAPTREELTIPLDPGDTFPPIRSAEASCFWKYIGRSPA